MLGLRLTEGLYLPDWDYIQPLVLQYSKNTLLFRYIVFADDYNPIQQELVLSPVLYSDKQIEEVYDTLYKLCTEEDSTCTEDPIRPYRNAYLLISFQDTRNSYLGYALLQKRIFDAYIDNMRQWFADNKDIPLVVKAHNPDRDLLYYTFNSYNNCIQTNVVSKELEEEMLERYRSADINFLLPEFLSA